ALNHGHADQNSYVFRVKGQDLLISGGYYPWYQSPHHAAVTRATRFKNALTFDGGIGQAEPVSNPKAPG
ncbi:MAG: heparinase II/III domain-containing protein, partial [Inhella sp.]